MGLDPNDVDLLQAAWRDSTWRTYSSAWKPWVEWCRQNGANPSHPRPQQLVSYLGILSRIKKLAYPTILVHKSVIVSLSDPVQERSLSSHPLVTKMLKAIAIKRSINKVQRTSIWNIEDMLEWLRANIPSRHSIFQISRHVALLLLLASGRRIHDLTLLCIDAQHCHITEKSVTFWPSFGSKTDNAKHRQSGWQLDCSDDPALSLVIWLKQLIQISSNRRKARNGLHNLFITTRGEVKAASRTVIAGWLKAPFAELGIECGPGSTRSAVASYDFQNNVPLDQILSRGNWRGSDNFFKHYCKFVEKPRVPNSNVLNRFFHPI